MLPAALLVAFLLLPGAGSSDPRPAPVPAPRASARDDDLAAARALFERNIAAIQQRDREAYLACYLAAPLLVRGGPDGPRDGFAELEAGTPPSGADDWPRELLARDLQLRWLGDGLVYGSYRYQVTGSDGSWRAGLSERLFRATPDGWRIVLSTAFDAPAGLPAAPLALVGATLHDGAGGPPVPDAVVLVRDGRIEALGTADSLPVPPGVETLDLTGAFIVPGLIDTHVHYSQTGWADGRPDARDVTAEHPYPAVVADLARHPERFHRAFLASGVTAVLDVGGYPWTRQLGAASETSPLAPHVVATGPLLATLVPEPLTLPDQAQLVAMESEDGVRATVRAHVAQGSDAIKVWYVLRRPDDLARFAPLVRAAGAAAREAGVPLVVHATGLDAARVAVEAGARLLVHSVEDQPVDEAFARALREAGTAYCPTLTVHRGYLHLYAGEVPDGLAADLERVHPTVAERVRRTTTLGPVPGFEGERRQLAESRQREREALMASNLLLLHEAGVPVVAGTDAGNPLTLHGPSMLPELRAMQAAGLAPLAVLRAATLDAAAALGRGDDLGLLAPGRIADLLVLEADPGQDIGALSALRFVMRAGTLHRPASLLPR